MRIKPWESTKMTQGAGVLHWGDWDKFSLWKGLNGHLSTKKIKLLTAASSVCTLKKLNKQSLLEAAAYNLINHKATQLQLLRLAQGHPDNSRWGRRLLTHDEVKIFKPVWEFKPGISQHKLTAAASKLLMPTQILHNQSHMHRVINNPWNNWCPTVY